MAISDKQKYQLLTDLVKLLKDNNCLEEICIYVSDRRYFSEKYAHNNPQILDTKLGLWYQDNINVRDYIEYSNPETLTLTFEGPLYDKLNYEGYDMEKKLNKLFEKYGLYFEYGHPWSLTLYED